MFDPVTAFNKVLFPAFGNPTNTICPAPSFRMWNFCVPPPFFVFCFSICALSFAIFFVISALTVGIGFIFHELAHKIVAQRFGCFAEFRAFNGMLMLAVILSFLGFIFAAPGAVMIAGPVGRRRNGKIAVSGPVTNLVLAVVFLGIFSLYPTGFLGTFSRYGFMINTWLALFNMIPLWQLDGKKVLAWSKPIYFGVLAGGFALHVVATALPRLLG